MKKIFRIIFSLLLCLGLLGIPKVQAAPEVKKLDVLFLHDLHSHLNEFTTILDGTSQTVGGFAKLKTLISEQQSKNSDTLILDAGDFSMGTMIQTVYEEEASELRMMGELGIDVTTFGNHEYDYYAKGIVNMLSSAMNSGDPLPQLVISNIDWESMHSKGLTEDQLSLKETFERYGLSEYIIVEKNDVRIAVTGIFGIDAEACVVDCPLEFSDPVTALQETIKSIKEKEDVDMIACVSHSGVWDNEEKSEDEILAKNVPELDLIISGHTHSTLKEPIVHGDTYIVSCGEYGINLGSLSMSQKENGRWQLDSYELIPVNESVPEDAKTQEKVDLLMSRVDSEYLSHFGYTREQILCTNEVEFCPSSDTATLHTELNLGNIISDAYAYAVNEALQEDIVDVAIAPAGTIRDTYALGNITPEHVFNSFSLGIGEDNIPGYPLIGVYLTGEELNMIAEIDSSISDLMTYARLYTYGLRWSYNPDRMILNKATDTYLYTSQNEREEIINDRLYYVVTDFYTSQMLGGVTDMSYGLLSIIPKFADGTPIEHYEDAIITTDGKELKAWVAIASYMTSFEDTDNDSIPNVPSRYASIEGRKPIEQTDSFLDLVKHPNKFFFMILGLVLVLIFLLLGILLGIRKIIKKRIQKKEGHK